MTNLFLTIIAAALLLLFALLGLGVGWLLSGKNRLGKRCGMRPGTCSRCGSTDKECEKDDSSGDRREGA